MWTHVLISLEYISKSEFLGNGKIIFDLLINC